MAVSLGSAATYAVLATTSIANTGNSVLTGDVGITPNNASSVSGFPPGTYTGTLNAANAAAATALEDARTAYNACLAATTTTVFTAGADNTYNTTNGQTLTAGVYTVADAQNMRISGNLILSGNSESVFIFKIGGRVFASNGNDGYVLGRVTLVGGVSATNVFWQVGSDAILGAGSTFAGTILSQVGVFAGEGASSNGGLMALEANGFVILNANTISNAVVCYVKGTKILTSVGYKNIEDIVLGDEVHVFGDITPEDDNKQIINQSDGQTTRKVIFNGYFTRSYLNIESKPIVFKAGSLGENTPFEDVAVSPGHGVVVNGKLILAINLVNYDTIYQSDDYEEVTYYHIELESHSVINAGGLLGETLNAHQHEFTPV